MRVRKTGYIKRFINIAVFSINPVDKNTFSLPSQASVLWRSVPNMQASKSGEWLMHFRNILNNSFKAKRGFPP